jgi:hypothetical protein
VNRRRLIVKACFTNFLLPFRGWRRCCTRRSLEHVVTRCLRPLLQLSGVSVQGLRWTWQVLWICAPSRVLTWKKSVECVSCVQAGNALSPPHHIHTVYFIQPLPHLPHIVHDPCRDENRICLKPIGTSLSKGIVTLSWRLPNRWAVSLSAQADLRQCTRKEPPRY